MFVIMKRLLWPPWSTPDITAILALNWTNNTVLCKAKTMHWGSGWNTSQHCLLLNVWLAFQKFFQFFCSDMLYCLSFLIYADKPELAVLNKEHWFTVIEGTKVELDCTCTGNPVPTYNWTLPSGELSTIKTSVFTIESVYEEHVGNYLCLASNGYGKVKEQFIVDTRREY